MASALNDSFERITHTFTHVYVCVCVQGTSQPPLKNLCPPLGIGPDMGQKSLEKCVCETLRISFSIKFTPTEG